MKSIWNLLICPKCGEGPLHQGTGDGDRPLVCPGCQTDYPVVADIPRFVPASNYADSFGFQWNRHARTQLDSSCGVTISADRVFSVTGWPHRMPGETVLEAGSGAGRFTEVLVGTGADVLSFDFSSAVDANASNNGSATNLTLFQGDIFNIPIADQSIDRVFCLGVIQHTPNPKAAFMSLASKVKPGGHLAIDVYADDLAARLQWKYLLRPMTKRVDDRRLYGFLEKAVPRLVPLTALLRKVAGRAGARLSPIVEYGHLGLEPQVNRQWAILDTFDMYSPAHDHPQSESTVRQWFAEIGFCDVEVGRGPNGVVGRGRRPAK